MPPSSSSTAATPLPLPPQAEKKPRRRTREVSSRYLSTPAPSPSPSPSPSLQPLLNQLESSISAHHQSHLTLLSSLSDLLPDLDLSLLILSSLTRRPFTPTPIPTPSTPVTPVRRPLPAPDHSLPRTRPKLSPSEASPDPVDPLTVVRTLVSLALLHLVPFSEIDSAALLRRIETDTNSSPSEKAALLKLGGDLGSVAAVELALRKISEESGAVQLEEFLLNGKSLLMVWSIDRSKLVKELPESSVDRVRPATVDTLAGDGNGNGMPPPTVFGGPRGGGGRGMGGMGYPRMMGIGPPMQRPMLGPGNAMNGAGAAPQKPKTEEDELKDLEELLSKKSFREMQKSKTGEELLDLIHRPTARETAVAAKFKTKGGSQLKEYCSHLTKEDCRRQSRSFVACEKVHFRRIIASHTDTNLGDCSFLDTCRHTKTCKYVHYELDQTPDMPPMMMGSANLAPPKPITSRRAEYCSEVELGEPQWINCDIRSFRMDIIGQFGVIMADPPWDIHMELPYGTMADDEMRNLNVPALQTDGLIFLWVTGRAMELGRECLELWGYKRVEELIWVKTNQLQRIIRTGRTGHWLNHSKEHCLVGIKGNPEVNRNIDTDVIVAEVRETSRKPDEMYPLLERISPRTRKLELFARMHNTHAGWMSLGNQLNGVRLVDEGLRARFKAAYPEVEVQPASPPRTSTAADIDSNTAQARSPFVSAESKQFFDQSAPGNYSSEVKPAAVDVEAAT